MGGATGILTKPRDSQPHLTAEILRRTLRQGTHWKTLPLNSVVPTTPIWRPILGDNASGPRTAAELSPTCRSVNISTLSAAYSLTWADKEQLLEEFVGYARQRRLFISFYNIADDELPLFRQFGFQVTKWGEDAWIDLQQQTWIGKDYEWVRRQSNYCLRRGDLLRRVLAQARLAATAWNEIALELRRDLRFNDSRQSPRSQR